MRYLPAVALLSSATSVRLGVVSALFTFAAACIQVSRGFPCHPAVEGLDLLVLAFMALGWALTAATVGVEVQRRRKESQAQGRISHLTLLALMALAGISLAFSAVAIRVGAC